MNRRGRAWYSYVNTGVSSWLPTLRLSYMALRHADIPGKFLACPVFTRGRGIMVPAAALAVLWMVVFSGIPMIVVYIFLYSLLLLYFLLAFQNSLSVALFASSIYLFHTADLYMRCSGFFQ